MSSLAVPDSVTMSVPADLEALDEIADRYDLARMPSGRVSRALLIAKGIHELRKALEPHGKLIMSLQGTRLGFKTDKDDKGGYEWPVVRDCAIVCLMNGGALAGNQLNIIAGNAYLTKEFFEDTVGRLVTDLEDHYEVPEKVSADRAMVGCWAAWTYTGKRMRHERLRVTEGNGAGDYRIPIRVNSGQGDDAILGKAKRKLLADIFRLLTGSTISDGDIDDMPLKSAQVREDLSDEERAERSRLLRHLAETNLQFPGQVEAALKFLGFEPNENPERLALEDLRAIVAQLGSVDDGPEPDAESGQGNLVDPPRAKGRR